MNTKVAARLLLGACRELSQYDFLLENSRAFHAYLEQLGIPHEYEELPGAHNWDYWDLRVQDAITFFKKHLAI